MRDRLIELLNDVQDKGFVRAKNENEISCHVSNKNIADYLLANGVIVPPINIGQEFYHIEDYKHNLLPESYPTAKVICTSKVENIEIGCFGNKFGDKRSGFRFKEIGKTVFLTREEAEQALKGGVKE